MIHRKSVACERSSANGLTRKQSKRFCASWESRASHSVRLAGALSRSFWSRSMIVGSRSDFQHTICMRFKRFKRSNNYGPGPNASTLEHDAISNDHINRSHTTRNASSTECRCANGDRDNDHLSSNADLLNRFCLLNSSLVILTVCNRMDYDPFRRSGLNAFWLNESLERV